MTDIEIVKAIEAAGLEPPPFLVRKIQLIRERHAQADAEPNGDPDKAWPDET